MLKTIELNNATNIVPINKGLGSSDETLYLSSDTSASRIVDETDHNSEKIQITTLDNFVADNQLQVGLIKVDIEGFEQEFLKGASNTIKQQKPALLISIYHNFDDFFYIKPLIESWQLGYKFRIYAPTLDPLFLETLLIAEVY